MHSVSPIKARVVHTSTDLIGDASTTSETARGSTASAHDCGSQNDAQLAIAAHIEGQICADSCDKYRRLDGSRSVVLLAATRHPMETTTCASVGARYVLAIVAPLLVAVAIWRQC